jgi:hypothetical protein
LGPPSEERTRRLDERRVEDLQQIALSVSLYNTRHQRLPVSLTELSAEPGLTLRSRDPVTGEQYGYSTLDSARYELCAIFDRESTERRAEIFWSHGGGRHCFVRKAEDPR